MNEVVGEERLLVSIVTVVYNGFSTIGDTIDSVLSQNYENIEFIIIDGGSTDGTQDLVKKYGDKVSYFISEPDDGIYDAMNKGIDRCDGDIIAILNSDDYYFDENVISNVVTEYPFEILCTDTVIKNEDSEVLFMASDFYSKRLHVRLPFMHPSTFVAKKIYCDIGRYSTRYRLASDCDFLLRCYFSGVVFTVRNLKSVVMRAGGASDQNFIEGRVEYAKIYHRISKRKMLAALGFLVSVMEYHLYRIYRKIK